MNVATLYDLRTGDMCKERQLLDKVVKSSQSVCEIGCGTGRIISMLSDRVLHITGIEANKEFANRAKIKFSKNTNVNIIEDNFLYIKTSAKFDVILLVFNVLCEFITPKIRIEALKKAKAMLSDGGIIILANDMPDFTKWCKKNDCYENTLFPAEQNSAPWDYKIYINRDQIEQISKCQIKYICRNKSQDIIEDSYASALLTRSELLTMYYCLGFQVEEFGDYNLNNLTDKSEVMIHILRNKVITHPVRLIATE